MIQDIFMIVLAMVAVFGAIFLVQTFILTPSFYNDEKLTEQLANKTMIFLSEKSITCNQISELRIESINANDSRYDPLHYDYVTNQARDLWNAKSCGTHWGWFEK